MYTLIEYNDYRKEVGISCLGYCSTFEQARCAVFRNATRSLRCLGATTFLIIYPESQAEYVALEKSYNDQKLWKYKVKTFTLREGVNEISIAKFCSLFLTKKGRKLMKDVMKSSSIPSADSPLTQEWLNTHMEIISANFLDYNEAWTYEEENENEEDNIIGDIDHYSSVYAIVETKEIMKEIE